MSEPANPMLQRIRESVAGTYDLLGELGPDEQGVVLFLAREIATRSLVGLSVTQDDASGTQFTIEVRRTMGEAVTIQGNRCPSCNADLPELERFCFNCGADLSGTLAMETTEEARLLSALAAATAGRYEILGRMHREGVAGTSYFARELTAGRIVGLRLRRAEAKDGVQAEYVVRQTPIFRSAASASSSGMGAAASGAFPGYAGAPGAAAAAASGVGAAYTGAAAVSGVGAAYQGGATGTPAGASGAAAPYVPDATQIPVDGSAGGGSTGRSRMPMIAGAVLVLVAVAGYFALSGDDTVVPPPADTMAAVPGTPPVDSTALPPTGTPATVAAATPPADTVSTAQTAPADSATVRITATLPEGARVTVDGRAVRGRSLRVTAGPHQLAVNAPGHQPFTQRLTLRPGATVQWAPKLVATAVASNNATPTPPAETRTTPTCRNAVRQEDWGTAVSLCTTEANAGDAAATASLARMYTRGVVPGASAADATTWYAKAAGSGDRESMTALAYALRDGKGVKRDAGQSVRWFKQAAEQGDRAAQLEYAVALEKGEGTARDERAAREWYGKSAEQGNFMAARRLAKMFERGAGGARSDADAAVAYERAASLGDVESALQIGKWYRDGKGVAKSPAQALTWFRKAAELGSAEAAAEVRKLDKGV